MSQRGILAVALVLTLLEGCSSGKTASTAGTDPAAGGRTGSCATATSALAVSDVQRVIAQAVTEAQARSVIEAIAVVDRVGNGLAVFRIGDAATRHVVIASVPLD